MVWNIPSLDTHTLSVATAPWFDPTALQIDVEHLRHLICQLHAKVSPALLAPWHAISTFLTLLGGYVLACTDANGSRCVCFAAATLVF